MPVFIICYELNLPSQNYPDLYMALKKLNADRVMTSTWLVTRNTSAEIIFNFLDQYLDSDDKLLVVKTSDDAAYTDNLH